MRFYLFIGLFCASILTAPAIIFGGGGGGIVDSAYHADNIDNASGTNVHLMIAGGNAVTMPHTVWVSEITGWDFVAQRAREDLPFQTIAPALAASQPGDTIKIGRGYYWAESLGSNAVTIELDPQAVVFAGYSETNGPAFAAGDGVKFHISGGLVSSHGQAFSATGTGRIYLRNVYIYPEQTNTTNLRGSWELDADWFFAVDGYFPMPPPVPLGVPHQNIDPGSGGEVPGGGGRDVSPP